MKRQLYAFHLFKPYPLANNPEELQERIGRKYKKFKEAEEKLKTSLLETSQAIDKTTI